MGWLSKIFSSTGANVIASAGKVIDDLVSSDEEMALTENQKAKITAAYKVKMQELVFQLEKLAAEHEQKLESELTSRLKLDMRSDSWLSKNIRPMTLVFMTLVVTILAFTTVFSAGFTEQQNEIVNSWVDFFQIIMMTIYGFYFGSRGLEKMQKMRSSDRNREDKQGFVSSLTQEPRG